MARMIRPLRPFFTIYSHFTGFLAYNKLCHEKSNVGIFSAKRPHSKYKVPKLIVSSRNKGSTYFEKRVSFLRIYYLKKKASNLAETFGTLYLL